MELTLVNVEKLKAVTCIREPRNRLHPHIEVCLTFTLKERRELGLDKKVILYLYKAVINKDGTSIPVILMSPVPLEEKR